MKMFLTGISGLLGLNFALHARDKFDIVGSFNTHSVKLDGVEQIQLDLTSHEATADALRAINPDIIVNTAALTDVDECEMNPGLAQTLNVELPRRLAEIAEDQQIRFVHISTDQLFDGTDPWLDESDIPKPLNNYGLTKWKAEQVVSKAHSSPLIIRTNFFGWGTSEHSSFSDWILSGLQGQKELTMFTDVYFTPILINQMIDFILELLKTSSSGIFHLAGSERLSKYDFGLQVAKAFDYPTDQIRPVSVDEFDFKAKRPKDMSLNCHKSEIALETTMPSVQAGLRHLVYLKDIGWDKALDQAVIYGQRND